MRVSRTWTVGVDKPIISTTAESEEQKVVMQQLLGISFAVK
jgi:hypothetical protein